MQAPAVHSEFVRATRPAIAVCMLAVLGCMPLTRLSRRRVAWTAKHGSRLPVPVSLRPLIF